MTRFSRLEAPLATDRLNPVDRANTGITGGEMSNLKIDVIISTKEQPCFIKSKPSNRLKIRAKLASFARLFIAPARTRQNVHNAPRLFNDSNSTEDDIPHVSNKPCFDEYATLGAVCCISPSEAMSDDTQKFGGNHIEADAISFRNGGTIVKAMRQNLGNNPAHSKKTFSQHRAVSKPVILQGVR
ncbi:hypothetical protein FQN55_007882 [Onygenales sp. PD_40]|nr:hypothetical protein FQN55_007882 [Onygenales sp. PD_40]